MAFPVIDLVGTGRRIERCRREAGFTVKDLQAYFGFEYPQAIYKWQHGECLPTVDNLLALSRLLRVPMEDLLVYEDQEVFHFFVINYNLKIKFQWPPGTYNAQILRAARACI
ncbi:MAG: helix-turn-helix transcriptional regulator [Blautia sp.]|nr:helix-turn-helix transcriptional regulator [Blautia sp.]